MDRQPGQPKVGHLHGITHTGAAIVLLNQKQVVWLDAAVNEALGVREIERLGRLAHQVERQRQRPSHIGIRAALEQIPQRAVGQPLRHQVAQPIAHAGLGHFYDMRVPQRADAWGQLVEALPESRVLRQGRMNDLQRVVWLVAQHVPRAIDIARLALAKIAFNSILAKRPVD